MTGEEEFRSGREEQLFLLHAEVCRTLGHPTRLRIVYLLGQGELPAGELAVRAGVSPANVSQHLAALRAAGIVEVERRGNRLFYRLASREVARACDLMRQVLLERLERETRLLGAADGGGASARRGASPGGPYRGGESSRGGARPRALGRAGWILDAPGEPLPHLEAAGSPDPGEVG